MTKVRYTPIDHDDNALEMSLDDFIDMLYPGNDGTARLIKKLYEIDVLSIYDVLEILPIFANGIDWVEPVL